jgi:two-component system nitrate/nitrite response regulator NarL
VSIRVGVVAGYPAVRAGLRALLEREPGVTVEAELAPEAVAVGDLPGVDVLVVDLGEDPGQAAAAIESALPGTPVVFLGSSAADFSELDSAVPPAGMLMRDASSEELGAAVTAAAHGLVVVDPALIAALRASPGGPRPGALEEPLTERELEVLELVAQGLTNKAVALRLGISDHTVKFHLSAIMGKLGAAGRTEAVTAAVRRGLIAL